MIINEKDVFIRPRCFPCNGNGILFNKDPATSGKVCEKCNGQGFTETLGFEEYIMQLIRENKR